MSGFSSRIWRVAAALFALSLLGAALPARAGEVFKTRDFTLTLPAGWVPMSKRELASFNANVRRHAAGKQAAQFGFGFHPRDGKRPQPYPYLVARVSRHGRIAEASLRKMQTVDLNHGLEDQKKQLQGFLSQVMLGRPLYEPARHTVWVTAQMTVKGQGQVEGLTAIIATKQGFLQLSAWSTKDSFTRWLPIFHETLSSVVLPRAMRY